MTKTARLWSVLAILLATVTAALLPARAQAAVREPVRPATVAGYVVIADRNNPNRQVYVDGATVELRNVDGRVVASTTSGRDGSYQFDRVRPGRYAVHAIKRGVGEGRARVAADSGMNRVRIVLHPF